MELSRSQNTLECRITNRLVEILPGTTYHACSHAQDVTPQGERVYRMESYKTTAHCVLSGLPVCFTLRMPMLCYPCHIRSYAPWTQNMLYAQGPLKTMTETTTGTSIQLSPALFLDIIVLRDLSDDEQTSFKIWIDSVCVDPVQSDLGFYPVVPGDGRPAETIQTEPSTFDFHRFIPALGFTMGIFDRGGSDEASIAMTQTIPTLIRYTYEPLQHPKSMRLLTLCPGKWEDTIICKLWETHLADITYSVLSYAWGEPICSTCLYESTLALAYLLHRTSTTLSELFIRFIKASTSGSTLSASISQAFTRRTIKSRTWLRSTATQKMS